MIYRTDAPIFKWVPEHRLWNCTLVVHTDKGSRTFSSAEPSPWKAYKEAIKIMEWA